jgi:GTP-binding protein
MTFVDELTVFARSGRGGNGSSSILREPYNPRGGPDGGDGGKGGDVVFEVSTGVRDLSGLADQPHLRAESGSAGGKRGKTGAEGKDLVILVPDGTRVEDEHGLLADLVGSGIRAVIARGGRGGRGNASLATSRDRVPSGAEAGEPGEDKRLSVELRIVADVGLVGLPNAGKSTLLATLTAAHPKIADYPFTTLSPNLGVAGEEERFVVADVPGLVEGAHEGKGLATGSPSRQLMSGARAGGRPVIRPAADLATVRAELRRTTGWRPSQPRGRDERDLSPDTIQACSAARSRSRRSRGGLDRLRERLALAREASAVAEERTAYVVLRPARPRFVVKREGERFRVIGRDVERWVSETDLDDSVKLERLQRRLVKEGVERELGSAGARRGDEVVIGDVAFEFIPEGSRDG